MFNLADFTPARLQALAIGFLSLLVICLALTAWALIERSWRFECEAGAAVLKAQNDVLAGELARVGDAIRETKAAGDLAVRRTGDLLAEAKRLAQPREREIDRSEKAASGPVQPARGCADAWAEIERGRAP